MGICVCVCVWFQKQKELGEAKGISSHLRVSKNQTNCLEKGWTLRFGNVRQRQLLFGQGFWQLDL